MPKLLYGQGMLQSSHSFTECMKYYDGYYRSELSLELEEAELYLV